MRQGGEVGTTGSLFCLSTALGAWEPDLSGSLFWTASMALSDSQSGFLSATNGFLSGCSLFYHQTRHSAKQAGSFGSRRVMVSF